jgi:uroporphyrinogen-III synthase
LVTRPAEQAEALAAPLRELGANVLLQPAINIDPPPQWDEVDQVIADINAADILIFCSANGVQSFMNRLLEKVGDIRYLSGPEIAVVGARPPNHHRPR